MALRTFGKSGELGAWEEKQLRAFLAARGYLIGPAGIAIRVIGENGTAGIEVDVDLDEHVTAEQLATDLLEFVPNPNPHAVALGHLQRRSRQLGKMNRSQRQAAPVTGEDLLALIVAIRADG